MRWKLENYWGTPEITYPCRWEFKTIGKDEQRMRSAVQEVLLNEANTYWLAPSNTSRSGKYCSLALAMVVDSEAHRNDVFVALHNHPDIVMVL